jgi:hypothetical protein
MCYEILRAEASAEGDKAVVIPAPDGPGCTSMSAASESVVEAAAAVVEATGVRGRHEVDSRVGHQVGLEFGECRR